jgi:SdrD B-like domain
MRAVRSTGGPRRRWVVAVAGVLVLAALAVVALPAGAGNGNPTAAGVPAVQVPLGGGSGDCSSSQVGSAAQYEFNIVNPSTRTFTDTQSGSPVTFALTVSNGDKQLAFSVSGASVQDVVVNGGADSIWFDYDGTVGARSADSGLHAPTKGNGSNLYQLSHTTFCYSAVGKISGNVWYDVNANGTTSAPTDVGIGEAGQSGWGVRLYDGSSLLRTTTTDAHGDYEFLGVPLGRSYTVCEQQPASPGGASWGQTVPALQSPPVCSSPNEASGYRFVLDGDVTGRDFLNARTTEAACGEPETTGNYTIQFGGSEAACAKLNDREFAFDTWTSTSGGQFANLHPLVPGGAAVPLVEQLQWTFGNQQNSTTLVYDDFTGGANPKPMLYCTADPRLEGDEFALQSPLPNVMPSGETSCLIESVESAGGKRLDYVFSSIDGWRTTV